MHICAHTCIYKCTHTCANAHRDIYICISTHLNTHTSMHVQMHAHTRLPYFRISVDTAMAAAYWNPDGKPLLGLESAALKHQEGQSQPVGDIVTLR